MEVNSKKTWKVWLGAGFLAVLLSLLVTRLILEGIYTPKTGINLLVVGDGNMSILVLRPEEGLISWVNLPKNLKVKIYNSTAHYPLESLWGYGESEKDPIKVTQESLGLSMGVALARTIHIGGNATQDALVTALHTLGHKTNLSLRDRFLIRQFLVDALASKKILELDIPRNALDIVSEPDGKEFLVFNNVLPLWTKNKFLLETILNENAEVSVNNISDVLGKGTAVSRQLEAAGLRVVEVKSDEADTVEGVGCLFVSWEDFPITSNFIQKQIGCDEISAEKITDSRGDRRGIKIWLKRD